MATKISGMVAVLASDLDDTALLEVTDKNTATRKATVAQLRTQIAAAAIAFLSTVAIAGTLTLGAAGAAYTVQGTAKAGADQAAAAVTVIGNLSTGAGTPGSIVFQGGQILASSSTVQTAANMWTMRQGTTTAITEFVAGQATARLIGGSTNGWAFRNSANTNDNFLIADAGTSWALQNGSSQTASLTLSRSFSAGDYTSQIATLWRTGGSAFSLLSLHADTTVPVAISYRVSGTNAFYTAAEVVGVAAGFGTFALMRAGGNVVIGGTAAGATASGTLAFGTTNGTSPSATVDLVHLYGKDISAGNRALAIYQEAAPYAGVAVASTTKVPCIVNDTTLYLLATTVA